MVSNDYMAAVMSSIPTQPAKDEELPPTSSRDHELILEGACKTMRELVHKLVALVLEGEGDRSDLEYAKNFYDIGRVTMNHISHSFIHFIYSLIIINSFFVLCLLFWHDLDMVKLINLAKKIGLTDEEHR